MYRIRVGDSPSVRQPETGAGKRGILPDEIDNAGKAGKILDRLHKRQEEGLTTPKQIRCLEKYGVPPCRDLEFEAGKT